MLGAPLGSARVAGRAAGAQTPCLPVVTAVNELARLARLEFCRAAACHAILSTARKWPARVRHRAAVVLGPATILRVAAVAHVGLVRLDQRQVLWRLWKSWLALMAATTPAGSAS